MKTKTFEEILENFEDLRRYLLLFDVDSPYYEFSGKVTAALLDFEKEGDDDITILAIMGKNWITFHRTRQDLMDMFKVCEFVGQTEEETFRMAA
jgi:hypothetical protein